MIESQTGLPAQETGPATIWTRGQQVVALLKGRVEARIRTLPGRRGAHLLSRVGPVLVGLARGTLSRLSLAGIFGRIGAGLADRPLLNRLSLHLVVFLLAVGVVSISQVTLPQIDFLLPTPTPAPDLGTHTVTTTPGYRGGGRSVSNSVILFQAPVPHTTVSDRDRLEIITYTVQANDNVWAIAQGFGLKPETILWANPELEKAPDLLHVGQVLTILPVDGVYHTVQAGDTVEKLAKTYQTTVEKITSFKLNGLQEPYLLVPGQKLVIPDGRKQIVIPQQNYYPMTIVGTAPKDAPKGSGRFAWPTQGYLSQRYWSGHLGIDIANHTGTPIYAADDGYVLMAGRDTYGYGNQVVIDHGNGYMTRYAHLQTILVKAGDFVTKNQKIGTMGSTGRSTGPHLHFEVIYKGERRNTLSFLP